jgi:hypothetical protein
VEEIPPFLFLFFFREKKKENRVKKIQDRIKIIEDRVQTRNEK